MNSGVSHPPAVDPGDQPAAVVLVGDREQPAGEPDERVVLDVRVLVAVPEQLDRRVDQQQPEEQEHEREQPTSSAAPSAMKIARRISARMMPKVSTVCWCSAGTANVVMMITKTNRLSTDRLFSTM